jgi:peptidoglycan/LPS O-acetylase OafA/YrhL
MNFVCFMALVPESFWARARRGRNRGRSVSVSLGLDLALARDFRPFAARDDIGPKAMASVPPPPPRPVHYPALDGLRAIAVLLVLYNHAPQLLGRNGDTDSGFWAGSKGAWLGVDLFFVLSGFLITTILLHGKDKPNAFRRFWLRRALRIFPLAYLYLVVLALLGIFVQGFAHLWDPEAHAWAATYLINFHIAACGWTTAAIGLLWSLAVEEHFYLVWPVCVLRCQRRTIAAVLAFTLVSAPLLRSWLLPSMGPVGIYVSTFCRCDTLAFGSVLALAWNSTWRERVCRLAAWLWLPATVYIGWVILAPISAVDAATPRWFHIAGHTGVATAFAIWCAAALAPGFVASRVLGSATLGYVGRISYGLYVWHVLTAELSRSAMSLAGIGESMSARVAVWLCVLFAVATLCYRWYEAPLLRLKDRAV